MLFVSLALILMITIMILVAAYLRNNEYEDYDIRLSKNISYSLPKSPETFNLYRLNAVFKNHKGCNCLNYL